MSIIDTLVTDRTGGYYNAADLNRVGAALRYVADRLAAAGYPACWLRVSSANGPAWGLYRWAGFRPVEALSRWYEAVPV
mgnify:CR=1 FL=1